MAKKVGTKVPISCLVWGGYEAFAANFHATILGSSRRGISIIVALTQIHHHIQIAVAAH